MQLTTEILRPFVGGQAEIINIGEGYVYRGEVEMIDVEGQDLKIKFAWLARGKGRPSLPNGWIADDRSDYSTDLTIAGARNIGPSGDEVGSGNRIQINSPITGESIVLFPADGSKLDPSKVEGLELPAP